MRKFFAFLFLFVAVLLFAKLSFAQTSSQSAAAVTLSFPIAALGNCLSTQDCKTYCDDPTHVDACVAYAKAHGFYKESALDSEKETILADAKVTLGCDSLDSCRSFCQQSANATACSAFAQKHNLRGGQQNLNNVTLQKAGQVLGCTSVDSCRAFCENTANKDKCAAFAKENHLRGGDETVGPGGCTSESSCKTFCANPNNFQTCSHFVSEHEASDSAKPFTGPGGCTSEDSCKSFCNQNSTVCNLNPAGREAAMSATGEAHMEGELRKGPSGVLQRPQEGSNVAGSSGESTPRPDQVCHDKGCNWTGTSCVCNSGSGGSGSTSGESGSSGSGGDGSDNNAFPTSTQSVQGVETHKDFFQWLYDQLFH